MKTAGQTQTLLVAAVHELPRELQMEIIMLAPEIWELTEEIEPSNRKFVASIELIYMGA
jgi:hypothetical protein